MSEANLETPAGFTVTGGLTVTDGITVTGGSIDFSGASSSNALTLTDLSATTAAAGTTGLAYDNTTGVFTYTPADLTSYATTASLSSYATTASLATVATSGAYADITGTPTLATVATSGAYADLTGTPSLASYLTDITGESLSDLSNVASTAPADGQVLTYDTTNGWQPETPVSGGIALTDLSVSANTASGGGALSYDNTTGVFSFTPADTSGGGGGSGYSWLAGGTLQMQYAQKTDTATVSLSAATDTVLHTDLQVTITPSSASSKIRLDAQVFGEHGDASNPYNAMVFFYRNTTKLGAAASGSRLVGVATLPTTFHSNAGSTPEFGSYTFFDEPNTTSAVTYKIGIVSRNAETFYLNRTVSDTDDTGSDRGTSFISATEIAGAAGGSGGGGSDYLSVNSTGTAAAASGIDAIAIGETSSSTAGASVAIGSAATSGNDGGVALGQNSTVNGNRGIALGQGSTGGTVAIGLGYLASATGNYSTSIGYNATTSTANQLMLGDASNTTGYTSIRVGNTSYTPSNNMDLATKAYVDANAGGSLPATIATGSGSGSASAAGSNSVALAQSSSASASSTVAIGRVAKATSAGSISIGDSSQARGSNANGSIAIGLAADANGTYNPIAIGAWSDAGNYSTAVGSGFSSNVRCYAAYTGSAFGYKAVASGNYQLAIGAYSAATNNNANAVGYSAVANGSNANAFGNYASAYANQFVLGNTSINNLKCQDTSITAVSDIRDKTDITALTLGLDFVNAIEPKAFHKNNRSQYYTAAYDEPALDEDESLEQSYTFDQEAYEAGTHKFEKREFGFIAQDIAAQLPAEYSDARLTYSETEDRFGFEVQRFTMGDMTPILWKALRELSDKHDQLQSDYDALLARVVALENA